jgi:hypothetical protein
MKPTYEELEATVDQLRKAFQRIVKAQESPISYENWREVDRLSKEALALPTSGRRYVEAKNVEELIESLGDWAEASANALRFNRKGDTAQMEKCREEIAKCMNDCIEALSASQQPEKGNGV